MSNFDLNQTLNNTIGALYIGTVIAAVLYGFTTLQTYWYYHWYARRDTRVHQFAVAGLWTLDTLHLILICHGAYHYMVTGFGNFIGLLGLVWSLKLQVTINVLIIFLVHSLYTYRVWLLGGYHKNGLMAYIVCAVLMAGFAIGVVLAYEVYSVGTFADHEKMGWVIIASLATSTAIDFVIAGAMCYYLKKSKSPQSHLNSKISTLMQFVLGSGFLTSATSMAALIAYVVMPDTLIFIGIESFLTKLYINSFFAMLNARNNRISPDHEEHSLSIRISSLSKGPNLPTPPSVSTTTEKSMNFGPKTPEPRSYSPPLEEV
ncbi:hypothetical protein PC9H_006695 [Pleurotus ostreatus]|uniref:DUF6534 domain-containing protein n=2 Tax=Pleurotus TaxID=5320 RepID=A0A8H7DRR0_PLEOS|nr:uncharacterized protein PC9H_006695 [Pleurotus ostreatus]KAF7430980.1 hypothetical protein PC9H_006695 [Pleurotus ostreatus]KAG9224124.1 hypothetical protein CCMSSC00406_0006792 [Pleurotus cornucopiae]KAJ8695365.1 hypothetical protein PTI98_007968 [Pleurotus ostreatus]